MPDTAALVTELVRALAALCEPPGPEHTRLARVLGLPGAPDPAEYTDLFVLQLCPYASVYVGADGMIGGEARDRVAGCWRALGYDPPAEPDHLAALLALYATLAEREGEEADPARRVLRGQARRALLWEHLVCWLGPYLERVAELAPPFYRAWGALLSEVLSAEIRTAGPPDTLPAHLREAPPLADPRQAGSGSFLASLLAPARSGLILTRTDLARAARTLGLGLRVGERRFVLAALLSQDPVSTLGWLSEEARAYASRHAGRAGIAPGIARYWAERAEATAALTDELRVEARDSGVFADSEGRRPVTTGN